MCRSLLIALLLVCASDVGHAGDEKPLPPQAARKKVGEKITVEMKVQAAKDRLENRGEIYLDAEPDFRDDKNFAVVITKAGAASLKAAGITDPAAHFFEKTIRATGTVKLVQDIPRIEIDDAKQIRVVEAKEPPSKCLSRIASEVAVPVTVVGWVERNRETHRRARDRWVSRLRSTHPTAIGATKSGSHFSSVP